MKDNWKIGVLACMFIVAVCCVCVGLAWRDAGQVGGCALVPPLEGISGYIEYPSILEGLGIRYSVLYRGTTKEGGSCTKYALVTKSEYERVMYGSGQ